jgi:hypothetical protein
VRKLQVLGAVAAAATLAGLVFVGVHSGIRHRYGISDLLVLGAAWLVFAAGALLVKRLPVRVAVVLILAGGAAMQFAAVSGPPHLSDDVFRYIWDGRVQGAGIDPYEYVPAAPQLAGFRDPALWPAASYWCVKSGTPDPDQPGMLLVPGCSRLNRPWVHTIYPPVAEAYFFAVDEVSPSGSGTRPMQAGAGLMALAVTGVLLVGLHRLGKDPRSAVLWAWCPTVAFEAANDAHVDVLAAGLTVASLVVLARARTRGRAVAGGGLLGLAVATKLYPALIAPAIACRRPVAVASAAVAAVAAVYLPHLLAVGGHVLGYLPGYLQQEGYGNGTRFALLRQVLPQAWCAPAAVAIMAATALIVMRYTDPLRPADGAVVMVGAALIVSSPAYPWYTEVAVALAALAGRGEWLPLAVAAYLPIFGKDVGMTYTKGIVVGYLTAAAVAVIVTVARVLLNRRAADAARSPTVAQAAARAPAQESGPASSMACPPVPLATAGARPAGMAPAGAVSAGRSSAGAGLARPVPAGCPPFNGPPFNGPPFNGPPFNGLDRNGPDLAGSALGGSADSSAPGGSAGQGRVGVALAARWAAGELLADVSLPGDRPGDPLPDGAAAGAGVPGGPIAEVVLPCLDEAAALPYVLSRLPAGYRAIVVDNGSSDGSAEIAGRLGAQVVHEPRRGFGAACDAGLRAASAEVVCLCDCDGSLDLAELPQVAGPVLAGEADLMLGRRRPQTIRAWPPHARIANVLLARRVRRATGVQLRDLGPMRAARREPLLALGLRDRRFGYPLEMVLAAASAKWRIGETDVCYVPRTGRSKVTGTLAGTLRAVRDMRRAWKAATG